MQPGRRLGPYEIVAFVGAGGMGEVYRARDPRLERDIALKVLPAETLADPTARARLLREARMAARLNHPNICTVHEVGEADGRAYIAMELIEGRPLAALVADGGLPSDQVLNLGRQLAEALAHAHSRGVVHRDLKSGNVVITPEGQAKVLDFGLAKPLAGEELAEATTLAGATLTGVGMVAGTLAYMAPEQLRGEAADTRSDVWALGVVLYEMASGDRPFRGNTAFELSSAILGQPFPSLPATAPAGLTAVVERCLAKEPSQRYQRGGEVRAALETIQSGGVVRGLARSPAPGPSRRFVMAAAALVAVVALLAALDVGGVRARLLGGGSGTRAIRMAVLPFANLSGDPEQEYLSDGLTQEMIAQLGRLHPETLSVIARTSVMRYKGGSTPIDQIGRELGVQYVLEGSAQREGSRVRISAELIQVQDQTQFWGDVFEREMSGILALQAEVARRVADALALRLLPAEKARLASARTTDPEAYEAYLKGSQHWIRMTRADLDTAEGYFNLALEKDPEFAPAHAGMAWVWVVRNQMGYVTPGDAIPKEREAVLRALALDDSLAEAHYILATVRTFHEWRPTAAAPEWQRAIELGPNDPNGLAMYSHFLVIMGRVDEAMTQIDRAVVLDPFNVTVHSFRAVILLFARRFDEAIAEARKALAMEPGQPAALITEGTALEATGHHEQALQRIKDFYTQIYDPPDLDAVMTEGFSQGGFEEAMRRGAGVLSEMANRGDVLPTDVANFYMWAGDGSRALDWLEKAYEVRDPGMPYLGVYPWYERLHAEPRFQSLLQKMDLPTAPSLGTTGAARASS